ncbi:NUDIX hydrolase [Sutcliffiella horikoshii]|uniref:NUDIX hydrolase n=1 Tax=Sutcliffiella horikoshii TaxID=79883 RepID=UPI00384B6369
MNNYKEQMINSSKINEKRQKELFMRTFSKKEINTAFIEQLSTESAAAFIIGLQYYHKDLTFSDDLSNKHLAILAEKAFGSEEYIRLVTNKSLLSFLGDINEEYYKELISHSKKISVTDCKTSPDETFYKKLTKTNNEEIFVFSTTSQISELSLKLIKANENKINELNIFMVSPLILSHKSLLDLSKEHDVPDFAIPNMQFIKNERVDSIRRVLRILKSINIIKNYSKETNVKVNLYFYVQNYPNLKIRALESRDFLQLFPSSLTFANNLYRFGLEITNKDFIEDFIRKVKVYSKDSNKIYKLELNEFEVSKIVNQSLKECALYMIKQDVEPKSIYENISDMKLILDDNNVDLYIEKIVTARKRLLDFMGKFDTQGPTYDITTKINSTVNESKNHVNLIIGNEITHVSVGIVFKQDDKYLLIKKKKEPYTNKLSIIAGHLEEGESPVDAIRREVKEELNHNLKNFSTLLENFLITDDYCRHGRSNHLWYLFYSEEDFQAITPCKDEILEVCWMNKEQINKINNFTVASKTVLTKVGLINDELRN